MSKQQALQAGVTQKRFAEWAEAFDAFQEGDSVKTSDLWLLCRAVGDIPSDMELEKMSEGRDETLTKESFLEIMILRFTESVEKEFEEVFNKVDKDGSGSIDLEELADVMKNMGENLSEAELGAMLATADLNSNGTLSFQEFKAMIITG